MNCFVIAGFDWFFFLGNQNVACAHSSSLTVGSRWLTLDVNGQTTSLPRIKVKLHLLQKRGFVQSTTFILWFITWLPANQPPPPRRPNTATSCREHDCEVMAAIFVWRRYFYPSMPSSYPGPKIRKNSLSSRILVDFYKILDRWQFTDRACRSRLSKNT